jgi:hypothetical protein
MQPPPVALSVPNQQPVKRHEILTSVSCGGPCRVGVVAEVTIGNSHAFDLVSKAQLHAGGRRAIALRFNSRQLTRLNTALHAHKRVVAIITATGLDPSGRIALGENLSRRLKIGG